MKRMLGVKQLTICSATFLTVSICHAEPLPKWEIGAGIATVSAPDYPGSDIRNSRVFPIPYLVYRGDFLKAGRDGLRSTLFDSDKVEVSLSLMGTLPSRGNSTRHSSTDGKATVGLGPAVNVNLWNSDDHKLTLLLHAPVRTSVTVQSAPKEIGWTFSPGPDLHVQDPFHFSGWNLGLSSAILINDRQYNAHYYSVDPADVTPSRRAYTSAGGYSGAQATLSLSKRYRRYWIGSFMRYDTVAGAVFEDSPYVKKRGGFSAGLAMSWVLGESSTMVDNGNDVFDDVK